MTYVTVTEAGKLDSLRCVGHIRNVVLVDLPPERPYCWRVVQAFCTCALSSAVILVDGVTMEAVALMRHFRPILILQILQALWFIFNSVKLLLNLSGLHIRQRYYQLKILLQVIILPEITFKGITL